MSEELGFCTCSGGPTSGRTFGPQSSFELEFLFRKNMWWAISTSSTEAKSITPICHIMCEGHTHAVPIPPAFTPHSLVHFSSYSKCNLIIYKRFILIIKMHWSQWRPFERTKLFLKSFKTSETSAETLEKNALSLHFQQAEEQLLLKWL